MKDRMAQLEAELGSAHARGGVLEADAKRVEHMRKDLAFAKTRIEDLEKVGMCVFYQYCGYWIIGLR